MSTCEELKKIFGILCGMNDKMYKGYTPSVEEIKLMNKIKDSITNYCTMAVENSKNSERTKELIECGYKNNIIYGLNPDPGWRLFDVTNLTGDEYKSAIQFITHDILNTSGYDEFQSRNIFAYLGRNEDDSWCLRWK